MQSSRMFRKTLSFVISTPIFKPAPVLICGAPLILDQSRGRSKYEKIRSKFSPAVPKFDYSGDNVLDLPVELAADDSVFSKFGLSSDEVADADAPVYSIHNADGREQMELLANKMIEKFARNETDTDSLESKVAMMTLHIRKQIIHMKQFPKDKRTKRKLVEAIQLRKKRLKELQQYDIDRFNWICKELNITYIPTIPYNQYIPIRSRRRSEAIHEMMEMKESKLAELREVLAKERDEYYQQKSEVMRVVREEQDLLENEAKELSNLSIKTGYAGDVGETAIKLAHIKPIDKERWWRKHPEVIKLVHGNRNRMYK